MLVNSPDERHARRQRIMDLMSRLPDLEGCRLYRDMERVGMSAYVFDTNSKELEQLLRWVTESGDAEDLMGNHEKWDAFFREVTRRMHNTVAAAMSLREHTLILTNGWYSGHDLARVESEQVHILDVPRVQFVQQLRVYVQHRGIPDQAVQAKGSPTGFTQVFVLPRASLLSWRRWRPGARSFLESGPERLTRLNCSPGTGRRSTEPPSASRSRAWLP